MDNARYICPLCGASFSRSTVICHPSCPLSAGCKLICCPACGYQIPDENRMTVSGALKRFWLRRHAIRNSTPLEAAE